MQTTPTTVKTTETEETDPRQTTVTVRCTGHVRTAIGTHELEFAFRGDTLREFLDAFFAEYDVADLLIAETDAEATAHGWAPVDEPPGSWRKNPEGENTRCYARVCVNGRFNENLDGLDTTLEAGDRVALIYPFMFCC
ncbi:MoaD/ThiS family protein [Salinigranum halophilum]|uniref:MoaD/ThiS family protein n=1 Tax=Salinigranum halophilum TaxID=2565931 RepID=UPI0010A833B8|nr:pterin cluster protein [Salinigranum halophilum]